MLRRPRVSGRAWTVRCPARSLWSCGGGVVRRLIRCPRARRAIATLAVWWRVVARFLVVRGFCQCSSDHVRKTSNQLIVTFYHLADRNACRLLDLRYFDRVQVQEGIDAFLSKADIEECRDDPGVRRAEVEIMVKAAFLHPVIAEQSIEVLNHCRGDGPHVRGCWVVDLVLGKE